MRSRAHAQPALNPSKPPAWQGSCVEGRFSQMHRAVCTLETGPTPHPDPKPCPRASGDQGGAGPRTQTTKCQPRASACNMHGSLYGPKESHRMSDQPQESVCGWGGSPWKPGVNPLRALALQESERGRRQTAASLSTIAPSLSPTPGLHGEAGVPPARGPQVSRPLVAGGLGDPCPWRHGLCAWSTRSSHVSGSPSREPE